MSRLAGITLAFVAALLLGSCAEPNEPVSQTTVLSRGINGDPEILDPQLYRSTQAAEILRDIGEGLVQYDQAGRLTPGVAARWSISPTGDTLTFQLRADAKWSDGTSVIAEDFVAAFQRLADPITGSPSAKNLSGVRNADAISNGEAPIEALGVTNLGSQVLQIVLERPVPYFLHVLAHPSMFPICSRCPQRHNDDSASMVGNGAYFLGSWIRSSSITLSRNKYYWKDQDSYFERVEYHIADPSVEVNRFRAGELDVTSNIDPSKFELMKELLPEAVRVAPYIGVYYYGFNLSREPFKNNRALREALSAAIDRVAIVESITRRGEQPAFAFVPPNVGEYKSELFSFAFLSDKERIEVARSLFKEAGFSLKTPLELELRINTLGGHDRIASAVRSMWKDVLNVDATIVSEEFRVLISNIKEKETEIFRLSWTGDYLDPQSFLQLFQSGNPNNLTGYSNKEFDDLMWQAGNTLESTQRNELMKSAEVIVLEDHAVIPIYFFVSKHLVRSNIHGWENNVLDIHPSKYLRRTP